MTAKKDTKAPEVTGLALMRAEFPANQISKLPKPTKAQTDAVKANFKEGIRCDICGGWHHPKVVHLDYVGHAALTLRLLDVDHEWNWEPLAVGENGLPTTDQNGGMWIKLTVCGVTRLGYGDAGQKKGPDAVKEIIGDALRNAAMRFGAALDLWHKGDLHVDDEPEQPQKPADKPAETTWAGPLDKETLKAKATELAGYIKGAQDETRIQESLDTFNDVIEQLKVDMPTWWLSEDKTSGIAFLIDAQRDKINAFETERNTPFDGGQQ